MNTEYVANAYKTNFFLQTPTRT